LDSIIPIAMVLIALLSFINYMGIKQSARLNLIFTTFEISGLVFVIILAAKFFGTVNYLAMPHGFEGVFQAAALIFFAFIGFEAVVKLSEETRNPTKIIPKALLLSILITTILYILVAISAISVLDWSVLAASKAPLADVAAAVLGSKAFIILAIIAMISTANTVLIDLIATSRTLYGIASEYKLLRPFMLIHPKTRTPWIAILFIMIAALLFSLIGDIGIVAEITNFTVFVTFGIINASLIWLRYKKPNVKRPFRSPLTIGKLPVLALIGVLYSIFLLLNLKTQAILGGVALFAVGYIVYLIIERYEH
jgi:APA family basic amino acid/polyamine antiporter